MNESIAMRKYLSWLNSPDVPLEIKKELRGMISRPEEIESAFCGEVDFGTAGLRAVMSPGTVRMNVYTVAVAARALAECIAADGDREKGIVISYDSRNNSREFAELTARVAGDMGITVYLSDTLRPVPMLSFAVRYFGAAAGVMITASHNPKEYNGFKVYGENGGQITPELAARIKGEFIEVSDAFKLYRITTPLDDLIDCGIVKYYGEAVDDAFNEYVKSAARSAELSSTARDELRIIYTPLNGSGCTPVWRALNELGYSRMLIVPEQQHPDGDFPTLRVPNPEYRDTFDCAIKYAGFSIADIIIATDPDSDRLGVALPNGVGEYEVLSGNEIGILLMEYMLSVKCAAGTLPLNAFCCRSLVSTAIADRICDSYGVKLYKTPTGSKYIAELIEKLDENGEERFQFGFEEGNGYLFGTEVREKDAVTAAVMIAEMAAMSKAQGHRLFEQLEAIRKIYGFAAERSAFITREGANGPAEIASAMKYLRLLEGRLGPEGSALGEVAVDGMTDLLPEANMLYYELGGDDWLAVRPSGTEPKLKIYLGCYGDDEEAAAARAERLMSGLLGSIKEILEGKNI